MTFRSQELAMDVSRPGFELANPECTCQITATKPGQPPPDVFACTPSPGIPGCALTRVEELAARESGLSLLRQQLRRELVELN